MTIQRMPGSAITPGTITITQLESNVATVVSTGGGPKITNIQVTDNAYTVLDDTAVDITGGYIKITGTGFVTGCSVIVGQLPAASVTFISSTEVRAQLSAQSAGTYIVYLVNPDGGVGIRVNGVTHSASPAWQTASGLPDQYDGVAINLSLVATDATSYTVTSGSLPPGLSLNSNTGVISGTVSGVANDTLYTFTVRATDAQLQDSPRTFTVTITVSDPYFKLTTLLLSGSAMSANTVVKDSSTNNFNLTVYGDSRASNFTPYGTGWSTYFSSTSGITVSGLTPIGSNDLTIETFVYMTTLSGDQHMIQQGTSTTNVLLSWDSTAQKLRFLLRNDAGSNNFDIYSPSAPVLNQWFHFAGTVQGTTGRMWINGNVVTTGTVSGTRSGSQTFVYMGDNGSGGSRPLTGYLSNTRIVVGTAVYTANFSPTTTNLSSVSGTSLLTNQSNRFINLVGNVAATISQGSPRITSFNPFNITNTGVNGSMYFDGTGDYLSTSANTAFAMGTGDFTVEFWYYPVTYGSSQNIISHQYTTGFAIGTQTSGTEFYIAGSFISTATRPTLGMWNHVVCQRASGTASIYFNGTRVQTGSLTGSATSTTALVIGAAVHNLPNEASNGYLSDIRIVKGSAVYSGVTITPPAAPLSAIANTSLLTCQYDQPHNNHTFLDSSSNQFLITRNGNATQGTFSPFSPTGWSAYFDGTGDVLTIPDSAISQLGSSDFTVECWINTSKTTGGSILTKGVDENVTWGNFAFSLTSSNYLFFEIDPTPSTSADRFSLTDTVAISSGQWHHVAVTRSGNDWKLFRNGTIAASGTSSASFPDDTYAWVVGGSRVSGSTTATWVGYISNLRLIKGSAVYTTAFTPPTAPLTAITNTAFLICHTNRFIDASTNNFAITATGDSKVVAFSPFAPTAVYSPAIHGGSAYFDGDSDQLTVPNHPGFDLSTADFTLSFWYYPTNSGTEHRLMSYQNGAVSNSNYGFYCTKTSGNNFYAGCVNGSSIYGVTSSNTVQINAWNYCVVTRTGTTWTVYLNGVSTTSSSFPSSFNNPSGAIWYIGSDGGSGTTALRLNGYLSNIRLIKGNIIPSPSTIVTAPVTATTDTQLLLNFTDSGIIDSTGRQVLETLADAKSTSVVTKFTGGSMSFDGTGDYLQSSAALSELVFLHNGTPWTVDGWFYTGSTSAQYILSTDAASASIGMCIGLSDTNTRDIMAQIFRGVSGSWVLAISPTNSWSLNTWTHFAATFDSSKNLTVYINGVQVATASGSSFAFSSANPSYPLVVGRFQSPTPGGYFNGYISDLRVTRGYARYTANFTAPTVPARLK